MAPCRPVTGALPLVPRRSCVGLNFNLSSRRDLGSLVARQTSPRKILRARHPGYIDGDRTLRPFATDRAVSQTRSVQSSCHSLSKRIDRHCNAPVACSPHELLQDYEPASGSMIVSGSMQNPATRPHATYNAVGADMGPDLSRSKRNGDVRATTLSVPEVSLVRTHALV